MDATALHSMLVRDWAEIENTPARERRLGKVQQWHCRVERLADLEERDLNLVVMELKAEARSLAARHRRSQFDELVRDLAVCQAMGTSPTPPWRRRLNRLIAVLGQPREAVQGQIERAANKIDVIVHS